MKSFVIFSAKCTLDFSANLCYTVENGKGGAKFFMALRYKIDIMAALKEKGYTSTRIREEKLLGQSYLQQIRHGELVSWKTIDLLCKLLECNVGDIIEYIPEEDNPAE